MRSVVAAILFGLAACHGAKQTGPAWPEPSTTEDDGGESISPREHTVAAAVEKSADADDEDEDEDKDEEPSKPAATEEKAATPSQPATPPADDVIITDDIIIEIED